MANAIEIKKEMEVLSIGVYNLRQEKKKYEIDVRKGKAILTQIESDIEKIKSQCADEQDRKKVLFKETKAVADAIKANKNSIIEAEGELNKSQGAVSVREALADTKEQENNDSASRLTSAKALFKQEKADHQQKVLDFQKEKSKFYADNKIKEQNTADTLKQHQENKDASQQKSSELEGRLNRINILKDALSNKIAEQDENIKQYSSLILQNKAIKKEFEDEIIKAQQDQKKAQDDQTKAIALQKSFNAQIAELKNREKEINIEGLKVKKLIRNNNLEKELKQLEKELK